MSRTRTTIIGMLAALAVAALVPATSMGYQDLRSPDASPTAQPSSYQNLRSPDAGDTGRVTSTPSSSSPSSSDSDWDTVGFIAGGVFLLALSGFGARALVIRHGRHGRPAISS